MTDHAGPAEAGRHDARYVGPPAPPARKLVTATLIALVVAAVVLVTAVLPAEYGIDPLGAGRAIGLMDLFAAGGDEDAQPSPATVTPGLAGPVFPWLYEYRVDSREFKIPPGTGMEYKYDLDKGATVVYEWKASGFVDYDFHTEPAGKPKEASDSFDKGEAAQKRGAYTAPYDGIHGWYWENSSNREVTVTLQTAGFYTRAVLFLPKSPPEWFDIPARAGR